MIDTLRVRVAAAEPLTPQIRRFRLVAEEGGLLPPFDAGAHVQVSVTGAAAGGAWRSYSLIRLDPQADPLQPVAEYVIAVRLEDEGRGGSCFMHRQVHVGDVLTLRPPVNHFPLAPPPEVILLAGGIGITPILSMATALIAQGRPFALHYSGRSLGQLAFVDELRALAGERLHLHADDDPATRLSVDALLGAASTAQPIYVCGPAGLIDATLRVAQALGWAASAVHFERFAEVAPLDGDQAFEVALRSSGRVIQVPADKSVLDALTQAGVDVMHDCRSGFCGLCSTGVCSGDIDHRDSYLSDADKAGGRLMQVCVSRARSGRLVLDL
jgi:vanillate O-demethylase ferredoxin subunit